MVYFTVEGKSPLPGAIKRAYLPAVDDHSNNIGAAVDLGIKYIVKPDGIAVDWVGRWGDGVLIHQSMKCLSNFFLFPCQ